MIRFREIRKIREVTEWAARVQGGIPVFETGFEIDPDERIVEKDANIPKFTVHPMPIMGVEDPSRAERSGQAVAEASQSNVEATPARLGGKAVSASTSDPEGPSSVEEV